LRNVVPREQILRSKQKMPQRQLQDDENARISPEGAPDVGLERINTCFELTTGVDYEEKRRHYRN
jgi:hypothetical protein